MSRNYDNWLTAYVKRTAESSEAPEIFHFWTGVSTIAGALRRRVWREEFAFQWTPNFYIILVGPPGVVKKSTSAGLGIALLRQVPGIKFGPQSLTWQALGMSLMEAIEAVEVGDELEKMSCISVSISELGTFLKPNDQGLMDFLVHMWDGQKGQPFIHKTRGSEEIKIENPWLNLIGCTTPAWLKANFPDVMIGGGLTSRIVFVYGDKRSKDIPYPSQFIDQKRREEQDKKLIEDLTTISQLKGHIEITPEALEWGSDWYRSLEGSRSGRLAGDRFSGYYARKQTHVHKIAIVLSAAKSDDLIITLDDLQAAVSILDATENDMAKALESIGTPQSTKTSNEILSIIKQYKDISWKNLWRICYNTMSKRDFEDGLDAIARAGYIVDVSRKGNRYLVWKGKETSDNTG